MGNARFVGLGEAVHGSQGIDDAKGLMIAHLVGVLGFRAIAEELHDDAMIPANRCERDPAVLLADWGKSSDPAAAATIDWVCRFNAAHPDDPVHFYGMDIWMGPEDVRGLSAWVKAYPADEALIAQGLSHCFGAEASTGWSIQMGEDPRTTTAEEHASCVGALDRVDALVLDEPEARIRAVRLRAHETFYTAKSSQTKETARDAAMADLAVRIRDARFPGARTAVSAHTGHVAYRTSEMPSIGTTSAGEILRKTLGTDYCAIGVTGWQVGYHKELFGPAAHVTWDDADDVERALHQLGVSAALIDFHPSTDGERFFDPSLAVNVGATSMVPEEQLSALVFVDVSNAATLYRK